ncbi:hypothetical protein QYE76_016221 [Lolium multiflorum]|uniref:Uncharacterized protein n=1 Tax=Lolium multiflorum TaxID=4521 RepID=A0AAD8U9J5_LOLMU|nr:hypothetical protein QYE76_016221 [Lolium multiflorum]
MKPPRDPPPDGCGNINPAMGMLRIAFASSCSRFNRLQIRLCRDDRADDDQPDDDYANDRGIDDGGPRSDRGHGGLSTTAFASNRLLRCSNIDDRHLLHIVHANCYSPSFHRRRIDWIGEAKTYTTGGVRERERVFWRRDFRRGGEWGEMDAAVQEEAFICIDPSAPLPRSFTRHRRLCSLATLLDASSTYKYKIPYK